VYTWSWDIGTGIYFLGRMFVCRLFASMHPSLDRRMFFVCRRSCLSVMLILHVNAKWHVKLRKHHQAFLFVGCFIGSYDDKRADTEVRHRSGLLTVGTFFVVPLVGCFHSIRSW
jgi:hypothetical protein